MSYKSRTNVFSELEDETISIQPASLNFRRKAEKKLREIEILEDKQCDCSISIEERNKINEKSFWQSVLYDPNDPKYKDIYFKPTKKEKEKLEKKRIQLAKERERKEKEQQKKRMKEQEESERKFRKEQEEWDRKFREKNNLDKDKIKHLNLSKLELEYKLLFCKNNKNNDKTFRQLSLKYHPDKNVDKQEWAQKKQQELSDIKNKFELLNIV